MNDQKQIFTLLLTALALTTTLQWSAPPMVFASPDPPATANGASATVEAQKLIGDVKMESTKGFRSKFTTNPEYRNSVVAKLVALGPSITDVLLSHMSDLSLEVQAVCSQTLNDIGEPAYDKIVIAFKTNKVPPSGTAAAIDAFKKFDAKEKLASSKDLDCQKLLVAALMFRGLAPTSDAQLKAIIKVSKFPDLQARKNAAKALGFVKAPNHFKDALAALKDILMTDANELVRFEGIKSLERIGETRRDLDGEVVKILSWDCLNDKFGDNRVEASAAIGDLRSVPAQSVAALIQAAKTNDEKLQRNSLFQVCRFGPAAKTVVPDLMAIIMKNPMSAAADNAIIAMYNAGDAGRPYLPQLIKVLELRRKFPAPPVPKEAGSHDGATVNYNATQDLSIMVSAFKKH